MAEVLQELERVQTDFNSAQSGGKMLRHAVSLIAVAT
jgi:hypothetical protein